MQEVPLNKIILLTRRRFFFLSRHLQATFVVPKLIKLCFFVFQRLFNYYHQQEGSEGKKMGRVKVGWGRFGGSVLRFGNNGNNSNKVLLLLLQPLLLSGFLNFKLPSTLSHTHTHTNKSQNNNNETKLMDKAK